MSRLSRYFPFFVILSLLLHLGVTAFFAVRPAPRPALTESPFYVDLRDLPDKPRELDLPEQNPVPRARPAKRLGPSDQVTNRETAPKGEDTRDTQPRPAPPPVPGSLSHTEPLAAPPTPTPAPDGAQPPQHDTPTKPALSYPNLLKAGEQAAQTIAALDPDLKRKLREDVETGRAVFLDTEKDLLGSFFTRFRDSIEEVWTYPAQSVEAGEAGVCLYKIVVNRAGILVDDPQLLRSSGFPRLDMAAAAAVREASPRFGFLPKAYPKETLTIFAFFDYRIGNRPVIYGQRYYP